MVRETHLNAAQLVLPLFVRAGRKLRRPIAAMPGVFQLSPDELLREAIRAHDLGVPAVLLFGIPDRKDAQATGAYAPKGIVQQAVRLLKKELPELLVITDVCLCEYMEHGHCGIVQRGKAGARILNDPTPITVPSARRRNPPRSLVTGAVTRWMRPTRRRRCARSRSTFRKARTS
jgi:porphobilinogen synthase